MFTMQRTLPLGVENQPRLTGLVQATEARATGTDGGLRRLMLELHLAVSQLAVDYDRIAFRASTISSLMPALEPELRPGELKLREQAVRLRTSLRPFNER